MGQFLSIGIVTKCIISKDNLHKHKISQDELIDKMKQNLHFEPTIYDLTDAAEVYIFNLKSAVLEEQLIPFLEKFYPLIGNYSDFKQTIDTLKKISPNEWLKYSEEKNSYDFQSDEYGECDYLYFNKPFNPRVNVSYEAIMLSAEGKIIMEEYGRQFKFFKYCMQSTFSEFSLAKALRVYITG